jgi:hypothetical protein
MPSEVKSRDWDMSDQSAGSLSSGLDWKLFFTINEILYDILRESVLFAVCSDENSSQSRGNLYPCSAQGSSPGNTLFLFKGFALASGFRG